MHQESVRKLVSWGKFLHCLERIAIKSAVMCGVETEIDAVRWDEIDEKVDCDDKTTRPTTAISYMNISKMTGGTLGTRMKGGREEGKKSG